jgi:K+-transporting ATPase ATPase C chain
MKIAKDLVTGAIAIVAFTLVLGLAYPLVMTGVSQVVFSDRSNGSQLEAGGKTVGSKLIGRSQTIDTGKKDSDGEPVTRRNPAYFQPRPSATGYSASATYFANRGPNSASGAFFYRDELAAYIELNGKDNPGLTAGKVPVDAVTTSASGVDPHISKANARIQARRVAARRGVALERVTALVDDNVDGRFIGIFGEPGVNIPELNLALDKEAPTR